MVHRLLTFIFTSSKPVRCTMRQYCRRYNRTQQGRNREEEVSKNISQRHLVISERAVVLQQITRPQYSLQIHITPRCYTA